MSSIEFEFEKLAEQVSERAAAIDCTPEEYRDGCRMIISQLETDIMASEETSE